MTKEEALKVFRTHKIWDLMDTFTTDELQEMIDAIVSMPSLPSNLDEAAERIAWDIVPKHPDISWDNCFEKIKDGIKAGAEWYDNQMKMPNSSELISEWHNVKTFLEEKDFRGDEWRLAYNAFMFGFSRGINTQKTEK